VHFKRFARTPNCFISIELSTSLPHTSHPGTTSRANISSLVSVGYHDEIRFLKYAGFFECLVRFSE
jgi:hypothetical protein